MVRVSHSVDDEFVMADLASVPDPDPRGGGSGVDVFDQSKKVVQGHRLGMTSQDGPRTRVSLSRYSSPFLWCL